MRPLRTRPQIRPGLAWQQYGEQSTYCFHHVARERQAQTAIAALHSRVAPDSPVLELRSADDREEGLRILEDVHSAASPSGYDTPYLCFLLSLTMHGTLANSLIMLVRALTGAYGLPALTCFSARVLCLGHSHPRLTYQVL